MKLSLKPLRSQVMVITGASSGIGRVTAKAAAAAGAKVMLVARNEGSLREVADEITRAGGKAEYALADVADAGQLGAAAERAVRAFGRIDTWVNVAGTTIYAKLADTPADEHQRLFQTNYFGTVNSCLTALGHLRRDGGVIICVGSIASDLPTPVQGAYAASKHAVKAFVQALRMELTADGVPVAVTLIKPAAIDTPIAQHAANHMPGEARLPPPVYDPQLVADAILDAAQHIRRDMTVGGVGRLQVLVGTHFPELLDAMTGVFERMMFDPRQAKTEANSVFAPNQAGRERSGRQKGRTFSVYTAGELHPVMRAAGLAVAAGSLALVASRWIELRRPGGTLRGRIGRG